MIKVEFEYKEGKCFIQATLGEKMRKICNKFAQKSQVDINSFFFMYSGNIVNLELTIEQIITKIDKKRKIMSIIAFDYANEQGNNNMVRSPHIICPICKETARFELNNYRIKIYNCKNGHIIDNILLKEFEKTQLIDESLIKCDNCKQNNKSNTYNKEMFICNKCNMNLCPLCKTNHDKTHKIINYEQKYYICNKHDKEYYSYCEECKQDLCVLCKEAHKNHKIITYDEIIPKKTINEEEIKLYFNCSFIPIKARLGMIIDRINNVLGNLDIYFKSIEKMLLNFNINNINYNILQNINFHYKAEDPCFENIDYNYKMLTEGDNNEVISYLLDIYNEMNPNEIDLVYNIPKNEKEIKIFGEEFVRINKDLCKIIYNNEEYNLTEKFACEKIEGNSLSIKLKGINNVNFINGMFDECSLLSNLSNFSNWDTTFVFCAMEVFHNCKCLELPDISCWNTSNIVYMESMFEGCSSLKFLPDISNWNLSNTQYISRMFKDCSSLVSLPDISKWNISPFLKGKIDTMDKMFDGCPKNLNIPEKFKNIK